MSGDRAMEGNSISYQKKPRIMWIDIMRGLLMFWVIFGHITEDKAQIVYIYSFHMPAYFFLTGMTLAFRKDQQLGAFVLDKFLGLMVPYFVLNLYAAPFREWLEVVGEANSQSFPDLLFGIMYSNADSGYKMASNTLWFIPCLFLSVVIFYLITRLCRQYRVPLLPVDSEHSAIFQCLEPGNAIEKILLTASGGPFRTYDAEQLKSVSKSQALAHPTWNMGAKITIDSASMMNKGFEVIEAHWLFDVDADRIQVVVHPQSVIHSMVQFRDGAVKAQLGMPDMRLPIQYAFAYPKRLDSDYERLDFFQLHDLTFEKPDTTRFRCLKLAYDALAEGGNMACIMNAANEIANRAFIDDVIPFTRIAEIIEQTMQHVDKQFDCSLETYLDTDRKAREYARTLI